MTDRRISRSFSSAVFTGARMNVELPLLLPGEQYIPGSIKSVTLYSAQGYVIADAGEMWGTNYRIIFRFYVSEMNRKKKTKTNVSQNKIKNTN